MKIVNISDLTTLPVGEIVEVKVLDKVKRVRIALDIEPMPKNTTICQNCALNDYCDLIYTTSNCEGYEREDSNNVYYPKAY